MRTCTTDVFKVLDPVLKCVIEPDRLVRVKLNSSNPALTSESIACFEAVAGRNEFFSLNWSMLIILRLMVEHKCRLKSFLHLPVHM